MKNFVPRGDDRREVSLLMSSVTVNDDEIAEMCHSLMDDTDQPQLSPLTVIDKSTLVDMAHDIDDVVESVINDDELLLVPGLNDLQVVPPLTTVPSTAHSAQPDLIPLNTPHLTYVNNDPVVLVRLRRLKFHRYSSVDVSGTSSSLSRCVESSDTGCKSTHNSAASEKLSQSPVKMCHDVVQSAVVVLTELPASTLRSTGRQVLRTEDQQASSVVKRRKSDAIKRKSDAVKRKSADVVHDSSAAKMHCTDVIPSQPCDNQPLYVLINVN